MDNLMMIENSITVEGGAPKQFKILPMGLVHSQKGDFLVDNESYTSILKDFKERQLQIPIDYEHQTLHDVQAPAAGWIQDITLKSDGIYAAVKWTERGAEYLNNREYKYCSPVIMARRSDRKAVQLHSVALTNKPAIDAMTPIVNKNAPVTEPPAADPADGNEPNTQEGASLEMLAELLQLPATATLEDIYQAVAALIGGRAELKLKVDAMEFEAYKARVDGLVELALKEGKLAPYQRDWAYRSAMTDAAEFTLWLKDAPQVVPMGEICTGNLDIKPYKTTRSDELLGLTHDDVSKYR